MSLDSEPGGCAGHVAEHLDHAHPQPEPQRPARHRDEVEGWEGGVEGLRDGHLLGQGQVKRGGVGSGTARGYLASNYLQWNTSTPFPNLNIFRCTFVDKQGAWQGEARVPSSKSSLDGPSLSKILYCKFKQKKVLLSSSTHAMWSKNNILCNFLHYIPVSCYLFNIVSYPKRHNFIFGQMFLVDKIFITCSVAGKSFVGIVFAILIFIQMWVQSLWYAMKDRDFNLSISLIIIYLRITLSNFGRFKLWLVKYGPK